MTVKVQRSSRIKKNVSVETGDQTNVGLFIFLAIISALGIAVLMVLKKKNALKK